MAAEEFVKTESRNEFFFFLSIKVFRDSFPARQRWIKEQKLIQSDENQDASEQEVELTTSSDISCLTSSIKQSFFIKMQRRYQPNMMYP